MLKKFVLKAKFGKQKIYQNVVIYNDVQRGNNYKINEFANHCHRHQSQSRNAHQVHLWSQFWLLVVHLLLVELCKESW